MTFFSQFSENKPIDNIHERPCEMLDVTRIVVESLTQSLPEELEENVAVDNQKNTRILPQKVFFYIKITLTDLFFFFKNIFFSYLNI